jgi:phage-related protein
MADRTSDKPLLWLVEIIKSPPLSTDARLEAGFLLRKLQRGDSIGMPHSRPMPTVGRRCHELRIRDKNDTWRIIYRIDADAVVIAEVFSKKTRATPDRIVKISNQRLKEYDETTAAQVKKK